MRYPEILSPYVIPGLPFRWYAFMYIIGILITFLYLRHRIKTKHLNIPMEGSGGLYDLIFYMMLGMIVGTRLGYFIFYSPATFITAPWQILGIYSTNAGLKFVGFMGMSIHGGVIGVIVFGLIFIKKHKYKVYHIADNAVLPIPLALMIGRVGGNFFNAELYGKVTDSFIGIAFPLYEKVGGYDNWAALPAAIRPYTEPRHPAQLYQSLLEGFLLFVFLFFLSKRNMEPGTVFWGFVGGYGVSRVILELFREPNEWTVGFLTAGMMYSIPMIIIGFGFIFHLNYKKGNKDIKAAK